ncbi:MAG: hypothetical protein AB1505_23925 [Candidatus Latescibacterota bacterium]
MIIQSDPRDPQKLHVPAGGADGPTGSAAGRGPSPALIAVLLVGAVAAGAEPRPGELWREYTWTGPFVNAGGWQRVTDPATQVRAAQAFLPNRVNHIRLDDLERAMRAEGYVEYWGGHAGTTGKAMRVNGQAWHDLPRLAAIPGDAGQQPEAPPECYLHFSYATVDLPLAELRAGENTFEFDAGPQVCHSIGWGQWGVYGVTFRVYYDPASRPHPVGRLVAPTPGATFADSLVIEVEASRPRAGSPRST